ncbi:MAG TPA: DUF4951 domain-containing protein [Tepidisphaeraceae bacterium]|nr:DUF4951 domain-containing protein [Tepidisphaeraceae bacterium]
MPDFSLVPVERQPDFADVSLVPVDHDPFGDDGVTQQTQAQPGQTRAQSTQSQLIQIQPQGQPQSAPPNPISPAGPAIEGGSGSPFVDFFNQLAAPERAESEGVADLVQNHPTAAKIVGAIGLGSALAPPLAMAGAEGLSLFGAGLGGSAVADGLGGSTISGAGRAAAASTAARQAISEAVATLPEGVTLDDFRRLAGFAQGLPASGRASTEATAEIISKLKEAGITSRSVAAFQKFYENAASENPSNVSAVHRAGLLANILRSFQ